MVVAAERVEPLVLVDTDCFIRHRLVQQLEVLVLGERVQLGRAGAMVVRPMHLLAVVCFMFKRLYPPLQPLELGALVMVLPLEVVEAEELVELVDWATNISSKDKALLLVEMPVMAAMVVPE